MKRCLLLVVVVALLVPPPIHAHESSIKKATIIGTLAGIGTSILIVGIEPKYKDPYSTSLSSGVRTENKYNAAQIGMIGLGTGMIVGVLSYFYFDGKSKNYSMISNKEFQEAWKRAGKTERLNHRNAQIKPYFSWNPRKSINSSTIHSKVSAKVAHSFL